MVARRTFPSGSAIRSFPRWIGAVVGRARLSHEKLYDLQAGQLIKAPDIAALFNFDPYPDHVTRHKRRRQSPVESGIRALT